MAYIQPDGIVEFFDDLGLSRNYENTLYFPTVSAKDLYFDSLTPITRATALTYSRAERGFIRVEKPMSTMINVGYMRFKNSAFENKWFYAFVLGVEYINNITTQVNFELDVMVTWMGAFSLNRCYIERQHVTNDAIGANIADEKLETGEYVCEQEERTTYFDNYDIALYKVYNEDKDSGIGHADFTQGSYNPLALYLPNLDDTGVTTMTNIIDSIVDDNRTDEILCIKLVPRFFATKQAAVPTATKSVAKPYSGSTAWGNFVPHNNKLYTYPYKHLAVFNCEGDSCVYRYEYFNVLPDATSVGNCNFTLRGTATTPEVNIMLIPSAYKGSTLNYNEAVTMRDFPSVSFIVDGYKAYLAQRDSTAFGNFFGDTVAGAVTGGLTGGGAGAVLGGAIGATRGVMPIMKDTLNDLWKNGEQYARDAFGDDSVLAGIFNSLGGSSVPTRVPHELKGQMSSNLMMQTREKDFYFKKMCITKNYAIMIDNFFDMFGYAIRQHLVPNMNARQNWTYVKTVGCNVNGNLPSDDGAKIEKIFDKGVRFWKNHNIIGNYDSPNPPIT